MANLNLQLQQNQNSIPAPLTPRDIVKKQITDYHYHVTEEDFDRMVVTDQLSQSQLDPALQQADDLLKQNETTSYDILDNS
ncbi:MAG: hypothetical protein INR73_04380 [Williamsia sp.]|nr:hypothetical protein [Williamsia sp.]